VANLSRIEVVESNLNKSPKAFGVSDLNKLISLSAYWWKKGR